MRQKKQSGEAARDQTLTPPDTIKEERKEEHSASPENVKEKNACTHKFPVDHDPRQPADWRKGMKRGRTLADLVNSAEYIEHAAQVVAAAEVAKKEKIRAYNRLYHWRRKHGANVKALLIEAFKIPVLLALPSPGQITRKKEDPWRFPPLDFDRKVNPKNPLFKNFRPQWVIDSEKTMKVSGSDFELLRKVHLYMTREQCAAYLRVSAELVARWEDGTEQIPFAAYHCLRLTATSQMFKHWRTQWEDWGIVEHGRDAGKLRDPRTGYCYTAYEVQQIPGQWREISKLSQERNRLRSELEQAQAENTSLRKMFLSDGITDELRGMRDRLSSLMASIATAEVVDFPITEAKIRRKTA